MLKKSLLLAQTLSHVLTQNNNAVWIFDLSQDLCIQFLTVQGGLSVSPLFTAMQYGKMNGKCSFIV